MLGCQLEGVNDAKDLREIPTRGRRVQQGELEPLVLMWGARWVWWTSWSVQGCLKTVDHDTHGRTRLEGVSQCVSWQANCIAIHSAPGMPRPQYRPPTSSPDWPLGPPMPQSNNKRGVGMGSGLM